MGGTVFPTVTSRVEESAANADEDYFPVVVILLTSRDKFLLSSNTKQNSTIYFIDLFLLYNL